MADLSAPCDTAVRVTVTAPTRHLCPFKDEVDHGTVQVEWTTSWGATLELHALAELIAARADARISHEQWTADLAAAITAGAVVDDLVVTSRWVTAGLEVSVSASGAVPGGDG